jgi:outer membrane lipoprotein-sorting protein
MGAIEHHPRARIHSGSDPMPGRTTVAPLILLAVTLGLPSPSRAQIPIPDVNRVMDYIDDLYRSESSHSTMRMTVVRERGTRELEMEAWSKGDDDALIVIRSPAREAGTATLRTKDGLWNYAPRADRLIRIPTGLLSDSWMGSHFTNDDLMRETSYLDDYTAVLSSEERDGVTYLKATLTPKPEAPVVYSQLVFLITPDNWVPVRSEYYDDGELVRSMSFDRIQTVAGKKIPMRMTIVPEDKPDEHTVIDYLELQLDVPVDDQLFTRQGLRRAARG